MENDKDQRLIQTPKDEKIVRYALTVMRIILTQPDFKIPKQNTLIQGGDRCFTIKELMKVSEIQSYKMSEAMVYEIIQYIFSNGLLHMYQNPNEDPVYVHTEESSFNYSKSYRKDTYEILSMEKYARSFLFNFSRSHQRN